MDLVRTLFTEYQEFLGFDLCFQGFTEELESLPGAYAPPTGELLLGYHAEDVVGCVGLRRLQPGVCEMKRLYLRPQARGLGLGIDLCRAVIEKARTLGYTSMKLDTVSKLHKAIEIYKSLGFRECEPYCHNPHLDVQYYELAL